MVFLPALASIGRQQAGRKPRKRLAEACRPRSTAGEIIEFRPAPQGGPEGSGHGSVAPREVTDEWRRIIIN